MPPEPLKAAYHSLLEIPKLLEEFKPDIVIHIALAVNRNFLSIERGATRDGYHQYPDVARKVFNKAEIRKTWGKSPKDLNSSLDLDDILVKWQTQAGKGSDLKMSDDVGTYVFSFVYYTSIECVWKNGGGEMPVVFMHVPSLPEKDGVEKGTKVTIALVKGYGREHRQVKYCIYAATHISSRFSSVLQRIPK
jgi:pyroglutamyl-peptidase